MLFLYSTFVVLWLASMGGAIGSFLNVVVYRLPLGMKLASPGSRCPRCLGAIRMRHNIPVFGWLMLRGRCYDCGLPISTRYPAVELTLALLFGILGYFLVIQAPHDLCPYPTQQYMNVAHGGMESIPVWIRYGLQMLFLTTLLAAALIAYDRQITPPSLFAPLLLLALITPFFFPEVHHWPGIRELGKATPLSVLATLLLATLASTLGTVAFVWGVRDRIRSGIADYRAAIFLSLLASALVLGWQRWVLLTLFLWVGAILSAFVRQGSIFLYRMGTVSSWFLFTLLASFIATLLVSEYSRWVHVLLGVLPGFTWMLGGISLFATGVCLRLGMPLDYDKPVEEPTVPLSSLPEPSLPEVDHDGPQEEPGSDPGIS